MAGSFLIQGNIKASFRQRVAFFDERKLAVVSGCPQLLIRFNHYRPDGLVC